MKQKMIFSLASLAFAVLAVNGIALANDEHHPEAGKAKATKDAPKETTGGMDMMGEGMDMDGMMEMMHECMAMHKDGKMCEHDTMEKCQKNMKKSDCDQMMKKAKPTGKKKK